jgi:putative tryptophan/tyrosine transport system substrate-binding protein
VRRLRVRSLPARSKREMTTPAVSAQRLAAFVQRLRELGWIDGRNIAIEYRWAEGSNERTAEFAAEFVRRKVDVIVTGGGPAVGG